jgi:sugar lactone lactonase YvrE
LAGNGEMRAADGADASAAFLFPYGIAAAPDGSLYVSDAGAQTIRRIAGGKVTSVAGTAPAGPTPQARAGGYQDGPAAQARFSWPTGLAVARDGSVYIADTGNRVIRRLARGVVTTFAGTPGTAGTSDGSLRAASFRTPEGLAFDGDGNLYVADFGNGVRRISPDGVVTTLPLPSTSGRVLAVSASGSGANLQIAYTEEGALHLWTPRVVQSLSAGGLVEPVEDVEYAAGSFCAVAILGPRTVAVTDLLHDVVRLVRFKAEPFSNYLTSRVIAGALREGDGAPGGYADGVAPVARIDAPLGIARLNDGTLAFTDAGNRRIRTIRRVDARGPVGPDLAGLFVPKTGRYRITVIGDSFAFWNVLWPQSIAGRIEATLDATHASGARASVNTVRLDGTSVAQQISFVDEYLGDGQTDLVVMLVDDLMQGKEVDQFKGDAWRAALPRQFGGLSERLKKSGTQLLVVVIPPARSVSPEESAEIGAFNDGAVTALSFEQEHYRAAQVEAAYRRIKGVRVLALERAMEGFESSPERYPLYNVHDVHLSPQGATWVGDAVVAELARWKPWRAMGAQ